MLIIAVYIIILVLVSILSYRKGFENIFSTKNRLPWFLAGFSIFVINPDTFNVLSKMGIVADQGYSGLWIFYAGVLGAGFLPILFAPLWSRLKFMTDNQFVLLRFSGYSAKILHLFRAVYVGYLVVSLFIAQIFIGLSKLLMVYFEINYFESFLIISVLLIFIVAKNSLRLKVRTDFLNGIVYILAFALGAYFVVKQYGGVNELYPRLNSQYADSIRLFHRGFSQNSFESLPTILVYFFIQWWSINVLDGAGPEAQRFMNTDSSYSAFKAAFLPLILFSLVFLLHSFVIDAGILMINESAHQIPIINGSQDMEAGFISMYRNAMPTGISSLIFLAFGIGFISFLESFINWGSSLVAVDVFKTYLFKKRSDKFYSILSYSLMFLIGFSGILIAWYNTYLLGLQKFIFAMGAGVGPVFILRWFWWRINAWSQFTAMISSLFYAVSWELLYANSGWFSSIIDVQVDSVNMSYYAFKLMVLTFLVTFSWLLVTFITKPDDKKTIENFVKIVQPGGFWPNKQARIRRFDTQKLVLLGIYPIISILPFLFIWNFKFGSLSVAIIMVILWILLMIYTIKKMKVSEQKKLD